MSQWKRNPDEEFRKKMLKYHCSPGPAQYNIRTSYLSNMQVKKNLPQKIDRQIDYIGFYTKTPAPQYNHPDHVEDQLAKSINRSDRWDGEHPLNVLSRSNNERYQLSMRTRALVSPTAVTRSLCKQDDLKRPGPAAYKLPKPISQIRNISINNSPQRPEPHIVPLRPGPNEYQNPYKQVRVKSPPRDVYLYMSSRDTTGWIFQ